MFNLFNYFTKKYILKKKPRANWSKFRKDVFGVIIIVTIRYHSNFLLK